MDDLKQLQVVLETREDGEQDVVRVFGVYQSGVSIPPVEPGWTRNVVHVFEGYAVKMPGFRFNPRRDP